MMTLVTGMFSAAQLPNIVALEYYFDQDPGFENATSVPVSPGSTIDMDFSIDVSGLSLGFHRLYFRTKDETGKWGLTNKQDIYKTNETPANPEPPVDIIEMEYFLNVDPGFGNATPVAVSPGITIDLDFSVDVSLLSEGFHRIYFRTKDETGKWSLTQKQDIYITDEEPTPPEPLPNIVEIEYYYDDDPGLGNATKVIPDPDQVVDEDFSVDIGNLDYGNHNFYVRVKDETGNWSLTQFKTIIILLSADFEADTTAPNVGVPVQFTDLSTGSVSSWEWDFQNDGEIDAFIQNPTWIYYDTGLYSVSLTVYSGSKSVTKLKTDYINAGGVIPLVSNFVADTVVVLGDTAHFTDLSTGNPTSWQWDFENDGTIDSEEQNPEWVYNEAGLYSVSLTVSDETKDSSTKIKEDYIWVFDTVIIINDPASQSLCENDSLFFSVEATGDSLTYQWQKDEMDISGTKANVLVFEKVQLTEAGNYRCIVANPVSSDTSTSALLTVYPLPVVNLGSDTAICFGNTITFNAGGGFSSYLWNNGSTLQTFTINTPGTYWVDVTSSDLCSSRDSIVLIINDPPFADFEYFQSCDDYVVSFSDLSAPGNGDIISWTWNFGDAGSGQNTSTVQNPDHLYPLSGFYNVTLQVTDINGCSHDTTKTIQVSETLSVDLDTGFTTCSGNTVDIVPVITGGLPPYEYLWRTASDTLSTDSVLNLHIDSNITIFLEVTDANMCQAGDDLTINVSQVYEGEEICLVTLDVESQKNTIVWEKTFGEGTEYFNIYKDYSNALIATIPFDDYSTFIDISSQPEQKRHTYWISAVDSCGNESELSNSHTTMLLSISILYPTGLKLEWNDYVGYTYDKFYIYKGFSLNNFFLIDSTPNDNYANEYIDPVTPNERVYYRISITKENPCFPSGDKAGPFKQSLSNIADNGLQSMDLSQGWNGISTFVIPNEANVEDLFRSVENKLAILQNPYGIYWPAQNINTLGNWNTYIGYQIKMANADQFLVYGSPVENKTLQLNTNSWNLIPVLSESNINVDHVFPHTDSVFVKESVGWRMYWPKYGINTLGFLSPGKSYFVFSEYLESVNFEVEDKNKAELNYQPGFTNITPWNDVVNSPGSHSLAIESRALQNLKDGDLIGAFTPSGICAGMIETQDKPTGLTANAGDPYSEATDGFIEGEPIYYKLYRPSTGETFNLDVEYDSNHDHKGIFKVNSISVISDIKLSAVSVNESLANNIRIFPNPTDGKLEITIDGLNENVTGRIFDLRNKEYFRFEMDEANQDFKKQIDLSAFPPGIYLINITGESVNFVEKVVVM